MIKAIAQTSSRARQIHWNGSRLYLFTVGYNWVNCPFGMYDCLLDCGGDYGGKHTVVAVVAIIIVITVINNGSTTVHAILKCVGTKIIMTNDFSSSIFMLLSSGSQCTNCTNCHGCLFERLYDTVLGHCQWCKHEQPLCHGTPLLSSAPVEGHNSTYYPTMPFFM